MPLQNLTLIGHRRQTMDGYGLAEKSISERIKTAGTSENRNNLTFF